MEQLAAFIQAVKAQGASDESVVAMLRERGWPSKEVYAILARQYAAAAGVEIPEPPSRLETAREAFFHLLAFATLSTWVFATGSIWFELIASRFPDPLLDQTYWSFARISWQMASVIVAFPVFVWVTRKILQDLAANPDKAESGVRRWLTNIAMLFTALVFIGDLVSFVSAFLQGELTVRFVLKCLVVVALAGAVFLYYSRGLGKSRVLPPTQWHRTFAIGAAGLTAISIALGFWLNGPPSSRRQIAEDSRRLQDLYSLANQIHYANQTAAPANLAQLSGNKEDPVTHQPYEYRLVEGSRYELCAQFQASTPARRAYPPGSDFWRHPPERHCFALDAAVAPAYFSPIY